MHQLAESSFIVYRRYTMNELSTCSAPLSEASALHYEVLAERLRALAHPVRLKVLMRIAGRERCPCGDIVREVPKAQSTVSQHLKVLVEAGLLQCAPEGQRTHYQIDRDAIAALRTEMDVLFAAVMSVTEQGES